jgi:hypothetical protein
VYRITFKASFPSTTLTTTYSVSIAERLPREALKIELTECVHLLFSKFGRAASTRANSAWRRRNITHRLLGLLVPPISCGAVAPSVLELKVDFAPSV